MGIIGLSLEQEARKTPSICETDGVSFPDAPASYAGRRAGRYGSFYGVGCARLTLGSRCPVVPGMPSSVHLGKVKVVAEVGLEPTTWTL